MSLHRRTDGTYEARYYRDGTKSGPYVRENFGKVSPQKAKELYRKRLAEAAARRIGAAHLITFHQAALKYLDLRESKTSAKGFKTTKTILDVRLIPRFGKHLLAEITPGEIEAYMAERVKAGRSKATANREWTVMRAVMRFAIRKLGAEAPAVTRVDAYRLENRGARTMFIEPEEWRLIAGAFHDAEGWKAYIRDRRRVKGLKDDSEAGVVFLDRLRSEMPKIETLLYSGQRLGDVLNLQREDVDFQRDEVTWHPAKTGRKAVIIPMGPRLRAILKEHAKQPGYVWGEGDSPAAQRRVQRALRVACSIAGLPSIGPHVLRKTFASWLAREGRSLRVIQELLSHADPTITARHYAHLTPSALAGAVQFVEEMAAGEVAGKVAGGDLSPQSPTPNHDGNDSASRS